MNPMMMMMLPQLLQGMQGAGGQGGQMDLGALGGLWGSSVLGAHLNRRSAKKERKKQIKNLRGALSATESIQGASLGQQEALARAATKQQLGGYDAAKREAERLGQSSRQGVLDRETQLGARASQGLASRGLGSTTIGANLQRGIASDTNRQLQGINEGLGGMFADLALGRAGAEAAGTERLAGLAAQRGDLGSQLAQMRYLKGQTLGNFSGVNPYPQGTLQMALPGMSQAFGQFMGSRGGQQGGMDPEMLAYLFDRQKYGSGHTMAPGPWASGYQQ